MVVALCLAAGVDGRKRATTHVVGGVAVKRQPLGGMGGLCAPSLLVGSHTGKLGCCALDKALHLMEVADEINRCRQSVQGTCWFLDQHAPSKILAEMFHCCHVLDHPLLPALGTKPFEQNPGCAALGGLTDSFKALGHSATQCATESTKTCVGAFRDAAGLLQQTLRAVDKMYRYKHAKKRPIHLDATIRNLLGMCLSTTEPSLKDMLLAHSLKSASLNDGCTTSLSKYLLAQHASNTCFNGQCDKPSTAQGTAIMANLARFRKIQQKKQEQHPTRAPVPSIKYPFGLQGKGSSGAAADDDWMTRVACGPGRFSKDTPIDDTGATETVCIDCPQGKFQPIKSDHCKTCPAGKHQRDIGSVDCSEIPAHLDPRRVELLAKAAAAAVDTTSSSDSDDDP